MATNLDLECAKLGSQLAEKNNDKTLTDALSVLEQQGVYAFFLYLAQKKDRQRITGLCQGFLKQQLPGGFDPDDSVFEATKQIAKDIDKLLLARDVLQQSLIYGRYHAKARTSSGGTK